ncbi:MAG: dTMP kinase [Polyangiaceae bacterium]|nr:dTMP kinase [Polyangiaceae bacterium]
MIEGHFVVLEGIDGSGTSTQAELLGRWFRSRGLPVLVTHEPTDGPIGSMIHQVLTHRLVLPGMTGSRAPSWKTMALLFAADRLDHLETTILPNLRDGVTVISDRYDLSSIAYQCVSGGADQDSELVQWVHSINSMARRPDLTIVLDVAHHVAARRRDERAGTAELYEERTLQEALQKAYEKAESLVPGDKLVHVDGNRDIEIVRDDVIDTVDMLRHRYL